MPRGRGNNFGGSPRNRNNFAGSPNRNVGRNVNRNVDRNVNVNRNVPVYNSAFGYPATVGTAALLGGLIGSSVAKNQNNTSANSNTIELTQEVKLPNGEMGYMRDGKIYDKNNNIVGYVSNQN